MLCICVLLLLSASAESYRIEVPFTIPHVADQLTIKWFTDHQSANDVVLDLQHSVRQVYGSFGFFNFTITGVCLWVGLGGYIDHVLVNPGHMRVPPAESCVEVLWENLPARLHCIVAGLRPEWALDIEEFPYRKTDYLFNDYNAWPTIGMFLLQSPGRVAWKMLAWSLRYLMRKGKAIPPIRLHVLVHDVVDWVPNEWHKWLGEASPLLRGIHWCEGDNRFPDFNRKLFETKPRDNYYNKVFMMLGLARRHGYSWLASFDDDIYLPPTTLSNFLQGTLKAEEFGCGVLSPLLQNGVPSVEIWADTWLDRTDRDKLFRCFSQSSPLFCDLFQSAYCGGLVDEDPGLGAPEVNESQRKVQDMFRGMKMPTPWNSFEWYSQLKQIEGTMGMLGLHPVRGNATCMEMALDFAIRYIPAAWNSVMSQPVLVDTDRMFPYLCNNVFLVREDIYSKVITDPNLYEGGADEVVLNKVLRSYRLPICLLGNSFGLHPAYSTNKRKADMSAMVDGYVSQAAFRLLPW